MRKKKPNHFIIKGVVFPYDIMVCLGVTDEEMRTLIMQYCSPDILKDFEEDSSILSIKTSKAKTFFNSDRQTIIRFATSKPDAPLIAHEAFHATHAILNRMGMRLSDDSDEAYAYFLEYVTKEIYTKLK